MKGESLLKAILRRDFKSFLQKVFHTINPSGSFSNAWYLDVLADHLQRIGESKVGARLIVNLPPRCLKSIAISVALPAWLLGLDPTKRIIVACYSQGLSVKHSLDCRAIVESAWYRELFPNTRLLSSCNTKGKFVTTEFGFRMATSIGGSVTGEGADLLIVDDPHNPTFIHSEKVRSKSCSWFDQTFASRLNDQAKGSILVAMQRLHHKDLTAHLLKKDAWELLKIPAICTTEQIFKAKGRKFKILPNESIDPVRLPLDTLLKIKKELSSSNFSAQYMQEPDNTSKGMLQIDEISLYDAHPPLECIYQSWDTAIKVHASSDYSVCTTWGLAEGRYYLLDLFSDKLEYSALKSSIKEMAQKWRPNIILIEDKASGQSLIQDLRSVLPEITPRRPQADKASRFASILHFFTLKQALIPAANPCTDEVIKQLTRFPYAEHDDIVDSISQLFCYLQSVTRNKVTPRIRSINF